MFRPFWINSSELILHLILLYKVAYQKNIKQQGWRKTKKIILTRFKIIIPYIHEIVLYHFWTFNSFWHMLFNKKVFEYQYLQIQLYIYRWAYLRTYLCLKRSFATEILSHIILCTFPRNFKLNSWIKSHSNEQYYSVIYINKTIADKLIPNDDIQISTSVDYNEWLKRLDTTKLTNQSKFH